MMNGGKHRGAQILSPGAVDIMTRDHLSADQKASAVFTPHFFDPRGWGFGLAVTTQRDDLGHFPGAFGWDGGLGTTWACDPKARLVGVLLTQRSFTSPEPPPVVRTFWRTTYGLGDAAPSR